MSRCPWATYWTPNFSWWAVGTLHGSLWHQCVKVCVWICDCDKCCKVLRAVSRLEKHDRSPFSETWWGNDMRKHKIPLFNCILWVSCIFLYSQAASYWNIKQIVSCLCRWRETLIQRPWSKIWAPVLRKKFEKKTKTWPRYITGCFFPAVSFSHGQLFLVELTVVAQNANVEIHPCSLALRE